VGHAPKDYTGLLQCCPSSRQDLYTQTEMGAGPLGVSGLAGLDCSWWTEPEAGDVLTLRKGFPGQSSLINIQTGLLCRRLPGNKRRREE